MRDRVVPTDMTAVARRADSRAARERLPLRRRELVGDLGGGFGRSNRSVERRRPVVPGRAAPGAHVGHAGLRLGAARRRLGLRRPVAGEESSGPPDQHEHRGAQHQQQREEVVGRRADDEHLRRAERLALGRQHADLHREPPGRPALHPERQQPGGPARSRTVWTFAPARAGWRAGGPAPGPVRGLVDDPDRDHALAARQRHRRRGVRPDPANSPDRWSGSRRGTRARRAGLRRSSPLRTAARRPPSGPASASRSRGSNGTARCRTGPPRSG